MTENAAERPDRLILVPGLLEPSFAFLPLRRCVKNDVASVECWRDRIIFRSLQSSVDRLADAIAGDADSGESVGIVTHSFGDWVARAAIAKSRHHRVVALASLAPVMRAGFLPTLLYGVSGNMIPEIEIIMNREKASANLNCDERLRRLVVWSRFDESLRSISLAHVQNVQVQRVCASHISIVWQPNVLRLVKRFLFGPVKVQSLVSDCNDPCEHNQETPPCK